MQPIPLRTTVIGSYPFPGWLEFAASNLDRFGHDDLVEVQQDAVVAAVFDQLAAGLDCITDGEQSRLDFNLSFYGYLNGIELEPVSPRRFGPPAHDQRGKHKIVDSLSAPNGLGAVEEYQRLVKTVTALGADDKVALKASLPGPYTMSGRLEPNEEYSDRFAITEALLPIIQNELIALVEAGCREITVDEPSMSCYAYKSDPNRFVDIFNRTIEPIQGKCRIGTHLCFGNFKARAVAKRQYAPMFPAFFDLNVDELHFEMASREFHELELIGEVAEYKDVAVGIIDVKSYYIETPEDVAERVAACLKFAPAHRLAFAPDCGLSQTARWAAKQKLQNMVEGVKLARARL